MREALALETFVPKTLKRKEGRNHNRQGSVRNINGKIYVDFMYLGERVREKAGLTWNESNEKLVRKQLDRIIVKIEDGTFRFAEVFPNSKKKDYFTEKERLAFNRKPLPSEIKIGDYMWKWYELARSTGGRKGRTLLSYKSYMTNYLEPFFGEMTFADLNAVVLKQYVSWSRTRHYRGKKICLKTVHKILVPLKMICTEAAIEYGWGSTYNPFFGFKREKGEGEGEGEDSTYEINPFSKEEQEKLIEELPDHWKPYFRFAFSSGVRPGEQIAIKPKDIDWEKHQLHIRRAMTLDENGKKVMGSTKNKYSRRTITLIPAMYDSLKEQREIYEQFKCKYFFCTTQGNQVDLANLQRRVWEPALERAKLIPEIEDVEEDEEDKKKKKKRQTRQMRQTRHSFATLALDCGEKLSWIAQVMGHCNIQMIIKIYYKQIREIEARKSNDGMRFSNMQKGNSNDK